MKKLFLSFSVLLTLGFSVFGQLKISDGSEAIIVSNVDGALMELTSQDSSKGVRLPLVKLTDTATFQLGDGTNSAKTSYPDGKGLLVYHIGDATSADTVLTIPGLFIWDGGEWQLVANATTSEALRKIGDGDGGGTTPPPLSGGTSGIYLSASSLTGGGKDDFDIVSVITDLAGTGDDTEEIDVKKNNTKEFKARWYSELISSAVTLNPSLFTGRLTMEVSKKDAEAFLVLEMYIVDNSLSIVDAGTGIVGSEGVDPIVIAESEAFTVPDDKGTRHMKLSGMTHGTITVPVNHRLMIKILVDKTNDKDAKYKIKWGETNINFIYVFNAGIL